MTVDKLESMVIAWGHSLNGELGVGIRTVGKEMLYNTPTIRIRGEMYNRVYITHTVQNFLSKARTQSYNNVVLTVEVGDYLKVTRVDFPRTPKWVNKGK